MNDELRAVNSRGVGDVVYQCNEESSRNSEDCGLGIQPTVDWSEPICSSFPMQGQIQPLYSGRQGLTRARRRSRWHLNVIMIVLLFIALSRKGRMSQSADLN
jgi:hypothetical protein